MRGTGKSVHGGGGGRRPYGFHVRCHSGDSGDARAITTAGGGNRAITAPRTHLSQTCAVVVHASWSHGRFIAGWNSNSGPARDVIRTFVCLSLLCLCVCVS